MRKFSSDGPIDIDLHYHVPRTALIDFAEQQLLGDVFDKGGHYITVWAPRQRGKSWTMQQVLWRLMKIVQQIWSSLKGQLVTNLLDQLANRSEL